MGSRTVGGYPGSAELIDDYPRWASYIKDSLNETTVGRDILLMSRVDKPALLRRLFELGCLYSGGASLANGVAGKQIGVCYWRDRNREVDFVLNRGDDLVAIEVKVGRTCLTTIRSPSHSSRR